MSYISHEDYKSLMAKFQANSTKGMLSEALDPVGREDADVDNDGDTDKTDKYLLKRRKAISKAMKEGDVEEYGYADNYPGSWGYRESEGDERLEKIARALKDNYGMTKQEVYNTLINKQDAEGLIAQATVDKVFGMEERKPHRSVTSRGMKESETGDAPISKMTRKDMLDFLGKTEEEVKGMSDEDLRDAIADLSQDAMGEGLHTPPLQATGPTVDVTEAEDSNMRSPEHVAKVVVQKHGAELKPLFDKYQASHREYMKSISDESVDPVAASKAHNAIVKEFQNKAINWAGHEMLGAGMDRTQVGNLLSGYGYFEDWVSDYLDTLNAELKNKGTVKENSVIDAPFGVANPGMKTQLAGPGLELSNLTTDERKQLEEYVDAIKTTKEAIEKLLRKASGKDMKVKEGGDTTGLIMTPSTMSETKMDSEMYDRIEGLLDTKLHDAFEKVTGMIVKDLVADGFEEEDIAMYLKYEIEKKAKEAIMGQHD